MKILKSKEIIPYKEKLFNDQKGMCPLCLNPLIDITSSHLDHDHALEGINEGKVRALLHPWCNTFEGTIKHKFSRTGMVKNNVDYMTYLENLVEYLKQDYSANPKHPKWSTDKTKQFTNKTLKEMKEIIPDVSCATKAEYIKEYKKHLKSCS